MFRFSTAVIVMALFLIGQTLVAQSMSFALPSAFSPNNDGVNDNFGILGNNISATTLTITGTDYSLIYASAKLGERWSGKMQDGGQAPDGIYLVYWTVTGSNGQTASGAGQVRVVNYNPNMECLGAEIEGLFFETMITNNMTFDDSLPTLENVCGVATNNEDIPGQAGLEIFPNPTSETLIIRADQMIYNQTAIYSLAGEMMTQVPAATRTEIDVRDYPAGVYLVEFAGQSGHEVMTFIKE